MKRYLSIQIGLHWLIALLILTAFGLIWYFGSVEITSPATFKLKASLVAWHKWAGMTVLILAIIRLVVRFKAKAPAPIAHQPAWQRKAASLTHVLLYLLMLLIPILGWMMTSAKGYPVVLYGVWQVPDLISANPDIDSMLGDLLDSTHGTPLGNVLGLVLDRTLGATLKNLHEIAAYTLLVLVGLHAAAALKHHFIDHDETLKRMLPSCRKGDSRV